MKLEQMSEKLGFQWKNDSFVRTHNGYEVNLVLYKVPGSYVKMPMLLFVFSRMVEKSEQKLIHKAFGLRGLFKESVAMLDNAVLTSANFKTKEKLDEFLDKATNAFQTANVVQLDNCPYCMQKDTDSRRLIKGASIAVHEVCVNRFIEGISTHLEKENKSKKYMLISIMFAVIGGFIGLVPSIIVLALTSFYSAWLFLFIPFAAFYGYKLGGAPRGTYVMPLIVAISLILAPGFMAYIYLDFALYNNVTFAELLSDAEIKKAFVSDMLTTVLFTLLAVWVSWKYIYKQTQGRIKKDLEELKK